MNIPRLKSPSYKIISSATMTNSWSSLTLISLGNNLTIKDISKNEIIATGSIGTQEVEFKSLEDVFKETSELYVIIFGINYSGQVSLTINSDIVSNIFYYRRRRML